MNFLSSIFKSKPKEVIQEADYMDTVDYIQVYFDDEMQKYRGIPL